MHQYLKISLFCVCVLTAAVRVDATPRLQLDIVGGYYDWATETIVTDSPNFTLIALLTPTATDDILDTYYISAAIAPRLAETAPVLGSYSFNGSTYQVTTDMEYGTPPLEGLHDATTDTGDLQPHGIYETYFNEFAFQFSPANRAVEYNTQDDPGGFTLATDSTRRISYFQTFNVTSAIAGNYALHFDLYDTYVRSCKGTCSDEDIELKQGFAPFSHDAQGGTSSVPEPASMLLVGMGFVLAARQLRKGRAVV